MSDVNTQGKKFKPSMRSSVSVRVGDWVKVLGEGSVSWVREARDMVDNVYRVKEVSSNFRVYLEHEHIFAFSAHEFVIMEEDNQPVKTPRPRAHADLIKQWADDDSLVIEYRSPSTVTWRIASPKPPWNASSEYRIKPKTVPAWKVLFKDKYGEFELTCVRYKTEQEFNENMGGHGAEFIKFVLETEKQFPE